MQANPKSRLAGLTEEERKLHGTYCYLANADKSTKSRSKEIIAILESLAASRASDARKRALLKKHEWVRLDRVTLYCPECGATYDLLTKRTSWTSLGQPTVEWDGKRHAPDCAWAAELEGGE